MPLKPIKGPASYPCPPGFNGRWAGAYRWFSGRPLNGHRYTDATFLHRATMATDISGHASAYQRLAGWERFLYFRAPVMASPVLPVAWWLASWPTRILAMATLAIVVAMKVASGHKTRKHRREVIEPLAVAVAKLTNARHARGQGHRSVSVPMDIRDNPKAAVAIRLPAHWTGEDGERKRLAGLVAKKLGSDDLDMALDMTGEYPVATFTPSAKLPTHVDFLAMMNLATADTELALGMGADGQIITFSLTLESPHMAIAGGSGAGKSELLAYLVGEGMRRGCGVACLDAKFISHMWLRRIPGVLYASESEELHEALIWLDGEVMRRARYVAAGGDSATLVPLIVVMEEINGATNRLRAYWGTIKVTGQPMMSPALTALGNLSSMGRELRIHILMAGQSLTAKATAGAENRENFGARALARATRKQWAMLAPQIRPAPTKQERPGRWHLVVGDTLKAFQAPFVNIKEEEARLIEWATGGAPVPDVPAMMLGQVATTREAKIPSPEAVAGCSLRDFASVRGVDLKRLQNWRSQHPGTFPEPIATGANRTALYDWEALDFFVMARGVDAE